MKDVIAKCTLTGLVAFSAISTDLYLAAIPSIVEEFSASQYEGQLTLSVFMAGLAIGQLLYGPLSDYFGRKPIIYFGLILYFVSTLTCAWATSMDGLLIGRICQALAAASGPVVARAIVNDLYVREEAAKVMSILAATMAMVPTIAPVLGGWLLYWYGWRSNFYALAVFAGLVTLGATFLAESHLDRKDATFSVKSILTQLWTLPSNPVFAGHTLVGSMVFGGMFAWITSSSFIIIQLVGLQAQYFGYAFMVVVTGYMAGAAISSKFVVKKGLEKVQGIGVGFIALGALMLLVVMMTNYITVYSIIASVACYFLGGGMIIANSQMGSIQSVPGKAGGASSVFGFYQTAVGAVLGYIMAITYNDSIMPLALTLGGTAIIAWFGHRFLIVKYQDGKGGKI